MISSVSKALALYFLSACTAALFSCSVIAEAVVLEELVVTASKRPELSLSVPMAVSSINSRDLSNLGVFDIRDLQRASASVNFSTAQNQINTLTIRLRGIGTADNNLGFESSVGVFVDDFYQSRPGIALSELVDMERVEILRGPQSTLYGRNTSAGAVNLYTRSAKLGDDSGFAALTLGNHQLRNVQAAVGLPINQRSAARLAFSLRERNGDLSAEKPGVDDPNALERYLLRGSYLLEPNNNSRLELRIDHSNNDSSCCSPVIVSGFQPSSLLAGLADNDALFGAEAADPNRRIAPGDNAFERSRQSGISSKYFWQYDDFSVSYLLAYRQIETDIWGEADFTAADLAFIPADQPNHTEISTATHELRLRGLSFKQRLDWMLGAYYFNENIEEQLNFAAGDDIDRVIAGLVAEQQLLDSSFTASVTAVAGASAQRLLTQSANGHALFSHNIFSLTDKLSFTLGLRYGDEKKNGGLLQSDAAKPEACAQGLASLGRPDSLPKQLLFSAYCSIYSPVALLAGVADGRFDTEFSDHSFSYFTSLSYNGFDNSAIYLSASSGFKSGGINLDIFGSGLRFPTFDSEHIDSFELGYKVRATNGMLEAAAVLFYSELEDLQSLQFDGVDFKVFSLPLVKSQGLEMELDWLINDDWRSRIAYSFTDTEADLTVGPNGACNQFASGTGVAVCGKGALNNSPSHNLIVSFEYQRSLNQAWQLSVLPSGRFTSPIKPVPADLDVEQNAVTVFDFRLALQNKNKGIALDIWSTNLTDEVELTRAYTTVSAAFLGGTSLSSFISSGRSFGATLKKTW